MAQSEQDAEQLPPQTRSLVPGSLALRLALIVVFMIVATGLLAWVQRVEIADDFASDYLAGQGIEAEYEVVDVGLRQQHLRNLIIGPKDAPDLTIEDMVISTRPGFGTLIVEDVRLRGVRLFGTYDGETLSFGALDPLLFTQSDAPFELPDFSLDMDDVHARMDTPYGAVGIALKGYGHLKDGFEGEMAATAQVLDFGKCVIDKPSLFGTVRVASLEPIFSGPLRGTRLNCADWQTSLGGFAFTADARANRTLQDVDFALSGAANRPEYSGLDGGKIAAQTMLIDLKTAINDQALDASGEISFADMRSPWGGGRDMALSFDGAPVSLADLQKPDTLLANLQAEAAIKAEGLAVDNAWSKTVADALADSPLAPLWRSAGPLLNKKLSNASITLNGALDDGVLALSPWVIKQDGGSAIARFSGVNLALADAAIADDIRLSARIVDRSLPQLSSDVLWTGGIAKGALAQIDIALPTYAANGARLGIDDLRVRRLSASNFAVAGKIALTGPLPDGTLKNLVVPLNGQLRDGSRYYAAGGCQSVRFDGLTLADMRANKTALSLCPVRGSPLLAFDGQGVRINTNASNVALSGDLAGTPWSFAFEKLLLRYPGETRLAAVTAQIGDDSSGTRIEAGAVMLDSSANESGLGGSFIETAATIGEVPLKIEKGEGQWSYGDDGLLITSNNMQVSDRQPEYRFNPMTGHGVTLLLADGQIVVNGALHERVTDRRITLISIVHDLETSSGNAQLTVDNLAFGPQFQPELITPLTLGVIANVNGRVDGVGEIRWNPEGIHSDGRFVTEGLNLAAAFGPVRGLSGEIIFSNLLEMATPPGQVVRLAEVNPGVAAYDGMVRYQLLPNQVMRVEGGEWDFSGGRLLMEPTVFNLAIEEERALSFEVVGIDAAQFLSRFDFENISATGLFDGHLPMLFNQQGGRIEGGHLEVREGGGTVAYVGELTYKDLGTMANFAFNSLRSVRYRSLAIDMNGPLDGEMVTQINFAGLSQGDGASGNFITKQIAKLPIQFNVTIRAPFFQLITSARSFYDTQYLPDIRSITNPPVPPQETQGVSGPEQP